MADVKISDLSAGTALSGAEQFEAVQSSSSVKITADQIKTFAAAQEIEYSVPSTGFAFVVADGTDALILKPAGTLAAGSVQMPPNPVNGQLLRVCTTQTITALTVSPNTGQSVSGAPSTLAANGFFAMVYRQTDATWYRIG